jgi:hypothetical protein
MNAVLDSRMPMNCEVCSSLSKSTGALVTSRQSTIYHVIVPERVLSLCDEHAREVRDCQASTFDELRGRFLEPFPGQRSLIPRRATTSTAASDVDHRNCPGRRCTDRAPLR